ncbi:hypothetical protein AMK20_01985 [Streptomyces sp. TSRI0261]|nr:hypothetical protein AMK20_01985 [Streptomyces sp. TSRI0261]
MSGEVNVQGVVPSGLVGVLPGNAGVRTGVVHQDVDGADLGADEAGHGLDGVWIGQVGVHRDPGAARALEGGEEGVGVGVLAEVVDRDGRSGGGERPSDLGSDAGGPAGVERRVRVLALGEFDQNEQEAVSGEPGRRDDAEDA